MKFALIATVAAASANDAVYMGIPPVGMTFIEPTQEPLISHYDIKDACPNYDATGDLEDFTMMRQIYYTIWNSAVRGFYRTARKNPVSKECVGEWMDTLKVDTEDVFDLLNNAKFGEVTADKLKKIANGSIDIFYKNWEVCGVQEAIQDGFEWCTQEVETCMYQENIMERMIAGATPLLTKSFDLYNVLMADNSCLNDTQNLALIGRIIYDLTTVIGSIVGFERKFGYLKKDEIKSLDKLGSELQDAIDAYAAKHADDEPV